MSQENVEEEGRARKYREAVEPYLGAERLAVVGRFARYNAWPGGAGDVVELVMLAESLYHSIRGRRAHRLPPSFLLAVTSDRVHFFKYLRKKSEIEVRGEVLVLDRNAIRFIVGKKTLTLVASEGGYETYVGLDHKSLGEQGAAEVATALSE